jgi:hypothetical protein
MGELPDARAALPDNIAAFRGDAANTNEKPIYLGRLMLFSDQDLTSLKHNLVYTAVVSTVFAALIGTIADPRIPLAMRSLLLGSILTTLHAICIAVWNLTQSSWQVHPSLSPMGITRWLCAHRVHGVTVLASLVVFAVITAPMVSDAFALTFHVISSASLAPVKVGH